MLSVQTVPLHRRGGTLESSAPLSCPSMLHGKSSASELTSVVMWPEADPEPSESCGWVRGPGATVPHLVPI